MRLLRLTHDLSLAGHLGSQRLKKAKLWRPLSFRHGGVALGIVVNIMLMTGRVQGNIGGMFRGSLFILLGGAMYRFDAYLVAFDPGPGWSYFPSVPETVITLGLVALEIMVFIWLVKRFPILSGTSPMAADRK